MSELPERVLPTGTYVDIEPGWRMHLHDLGTGPAILFLHGSGPGASGWSNFLANAEVLVAAGYRCILLDSLGYGRSSMPLDTGYGLDVMAGAAARVMEALGIDTYTVIGNSQGGAQAIWLALHHPARVERLVLMAPGGLEEREVYMACSGIRSMMRCIYGPEGITPEGMLKVFSKQVYDQDLVPHDVIQDRFDVAIAQPRHVFESMRVPNQEHELHRITCPTLCLWGMDDVFCPVSGAHKVAERVPGARVVLLSQCGHWVMVEHRAVFDRYVQDFLLHG